MKNPKMTIILLMLFIMTGNILSCKKDKEEDSNPSKNNPYLNPDLKYGSVTDIDGNVYPTIQIGTQVWMAENLKVTKYNDGTVIPNIVDSAWANLTPGVYNDPAHDAIYGKLYNWYAVSTGKLCPKGWHIPTDTEWAQLETFLGTNAGGKMKATGNSTAGTGLWASPNAGATNESGFTGLPGGLSVSGNILDIGNGGYWWSSTELHISFAYYYLLSSADADVYSYYEGFKPDGRSCRCMKD